MRIEEFSKEALEIFEKKGWAVYNYGSVSIVVPRGPVSELNAGKEYIVYPNIGDHSKSAEMMAEVMSEVNDRMRMEENKSMEVMSFGVGKKLVQFFTISLEDVDLGNLERVIGVLKLTKPKQLPYKGFLLYVKKKVESIIRAG